MTAIRLSGRSGHEGIIGTIPRGSLVQIRGEAQLNRMLEAKWDGDVYAIFESDLLERGDALPGDDTDRPIANHR
jgi:hypothetical protein